MDRRSRATSFSHNSIGIWILPFPCRTEIALYVLFSPGWRMLFSPDVSHLLMLLNLSSLRVNEHVTFSSSFVGQPLSWLFPGRRSTPSPFPPPRNGSPREALNFPCSGEFSFYSWTLWPSPERKTLRESAPCKSSPVLTKWSRPSVRLSLVRYEPSSPGGSSSFSLCPHQAVVFIPPPLGVVRPAPPSRRFPRGFERPLLYLRRPAPPFPLAVMHCLSLMSDLFSSKC